MHLLRRISGAALLAAAITFTVSTGSPAQAAAVTAAPSATPSSVTFDGPVNAVAYFGPTVFVAGEFTHAIVNGTKYARTRLAAFDAPTGQLSPWVPTANGAVLALATDYTTNSVYVAGTFKKVNGQPRAGLARLDFSGNLLPFNHTLTGTPQALATGAGRVYVGGTFTAVDGVAVSNIVAFSLASGGRDPGFTTTANGPVRALLVSGARLYLGGQFHKVDAVAGTARLAAVNAVTGLWDSGFTATIPYMVYAVILGPEGPYVAMGGPSGGRTIALTTTGALRWQVYTDGDVQAVTYLAGVVYYGGHFDNVCASSDQSVTGACKSGKTGRVKLAAANAANGALLGWNPQANGVHGVYSMAAQPSLMKLVAGGEFTTIGGKWLPRLVQFG